MKKRLLMICLTIALLLPLNLRAQTATTFSIHGGYSWLNGVVGAELQVGKFGISGGWMPAKMPMSGESISSYGFAVTLYSANAGETGYSMYLSGGGASQGYRYEDTWGGEATAPVAIIMVGSKYDSGGVYSKVGIGYGWCSDPEVGAFAFEILLGFTLFGK